MTNTKNNKSATYTQNANNRSLAQAMAEIEKPLSDRQKSPELTKDQNSLFSQALSGSNDKLGTQPPNQDFLRHQQEQAEKDRKKELLRQKLHKEVNPVDMELVFSRERIQTKKEIERLRAELEVLIKKAGKEIEKLHKNVAVTNFTEIVDPGDGSYYINFYQQLKKFILFLTQQIHSANTWFTQVNAKSSKRRKRRGKFSTGVDMSGSRSEQSTAVFDTMHHERSNAYAGG